MQPTTAAWNALLAAFRAGVGTEALFAVVIPSRALALTSRLWPPGVLPASLCALSVSRADRPGHWAAQSRTGGRSLVQARHCRPARWRRRPGSSAACRARC